MSKPALQGLVMDADITRLRGADYNPRAIDDASIARLQDSIRAVGMVKPLIARGTTLVAGHQRTRALRGMGVTTAPCYFLRADTTTYDEVRFNQLHNGTDMDCGDENARVTIDLSGVEGYTTVAGDKIAANTRGRMANVRSEIMGLMARYGAWGGVVATQSGRIIHCSQYAIACKILNMPMTAYVVPDAKAAQYSALLNATYGVFSYDKLTRNPYVQTFAQMFRLRGGARDNKSPTYEELAIPWLTENRGARLLDFGCGQGDYVKKLAAAGHKIHGVEFFRRKVGTNTIDIRAVNGMVDVLIASLRRNGPFDGVICDYVMNSVDSQRAEDDVLNTLSVFCKAGGHIFFSGRQKERLESQERFTCAAGMTSFHRNVEFLDKDGLTALYRQGEWFYQKFHSREDVARICKRRGWEQQHFSFSSSTGWKTRVLQPRLTVDPAEARESITREFNMKINSSGATLNRHNDVLQAISWL